MMPGQGEEMEMLRCLAACIALVLCALSGSSGVASTRHAHLAARLSALQSDGRGGITLLHDDFESYPAGVFPAAGGWFVTHPGNGGTIDTKERYSGSKSWRFDDGPIVQRNYRLTGPLPRVVVFECRGKVTRRAGKPFGGQQDFGMWAGEFGGATGSQGFGSLSFIAEPKRGALPWPTVCQACGEYFVFNNWRYRGPEVSFGKWYKLKASLDLGADTGSAWLNDELVFSNVPLGSEPSFHFAPSIGIEAGRWGPKGVVWVDDVRVYSERDDRHSP